MNTKDKKVPFLRTPYNYDVDKVSDETGLVCPDPSLAQQNFKDECDINYIVRQFGLTGELPGKPMSPQYGDFTGVLDYHSAINAVLAAQDGFMELPAQMRSRFNNDPAELIDFLSKEENREEATKLGLVAAKPISEPSETPVGETKSPEAQ
jgi:phage internal scaffolding protein